MYRTVKKTTEKTAYHCINCRYVKLLDKERGNGQYVECTAPNRCITTTFNARDYYCKEYKGFNDMTETEQKAVKKYYDTKREIQEYSAYAKKYYSKKDATRLIKDKKASLKCQN